ncbi:hypothetical protein BJ912DRAFT_953724 [Pholiota molesta]|nr:hypothetical protein BJ912DRAFT_953724 [Pholiota molesta]
MVLSPAIATIYYGAVINPVSPHCLLAVDNSGNIEWIVDRVESHELQQTLAARGIIDAPIVTIPEEHLSFPGSLIHIRLNVISGGQYELLGWLQHITFPWRETTIHLESTKILADIIHDFGQRALSAYKCNMDRDSPSYYVEPSVNASVAATQDLITYIPASDPTIRIQTHIAENLAEVEYTKSLFPSAPHYAGVYDKFGLLRNNTILAHAVHLSEEETDLIKARETGISHCPTSNFNLNSGVAPIGAYLDKGIKVGLGTDVSGGFSISMLNAIQNASIASKVCAFHAPPISTPLSTHVVGAKSIEEKKVILDGWLERFFFCRLVGGRTYGRS